MKFRLELHTIFFDYSPKLGLIVRWEMAVGFICWNNLAFFMWLFLANMFVNHIRIVITSFMSFYVYFDGFQVLLYFARFCFDWFCIYLHHFLYDLWSTFLLKSIPQLWEISWIRSNLFMAQIRCGTRCTPLTNGIFCCFLVEMTLRKHLSYLLCELRFNIRKKIYT